MHERQGNPDSVASLSSRPNIHAYCQAVLDATGMREEKPTMPISILWDFYTDMAEFADRMKTWTCSGFWTFDLPCPHGETRKTQGCVQPEGTRDAQIEPDLIG